MKYMFLCVAILFSQALDASAEKFITAAQIATVGLLFHSEIESTTDYQIAELNAYHSQAWLNNLATNGCVIESDEFRYDATTNRYSLSEDTEIQLGKEAREEFKTYSADNIEYAKKKWPHFADNGDEAIIEDIIDRKREQKSYSYNTSDRPDARYTVINNKAIQKKEEIASISTRRIMLTIGVVGGLELVKKFVQ